ncbi:MAG: TolC family protein [Rhodospirillaceae bacterium]|jgi:outer membrane protein, adhesin transport system|nr:TolC family protein [Rhodospirillaceae bacterium]MBT5245380.1 TolC family protein [Rhodospirillaceae bacterium]MBT5562536.1 TolC family protein [Rhodospirillaceae bacterium]MBT6242891.1 TolC family protein [Rhodospirillaceae bacterium]
MKLFGFVAAFFFAWISVSHAQEEIPELNVHQIIELIESNGSYAFAAAAADIDIARARRDQAKSALYPRLSLNATGQGYQSTQKWLEDNAEIYGGLEVVQPIYDFGKSGAAIDAAGSDVEAAEMALVSARNAVLLEGMALFFELHASELQLRAYNEIHASAYVRWDRAKEQLDLGRASPLDVAKALALVEKTRLDYYRERSRNNTFRIRLEELIAQELPQELISPPPPPQKAPMEVDREEFALVVIKRNPQTAALVKQVQATRLRRGGVSNFPNLEAFGNLGHSSRDMRGRNEYALGARLSWSIFNGGIEKAERNQLAAEESRFGAMLEVKRRHLRRQAFAVLMDRHDAYQRVIAARAGLDYAQKNLLRRQQLYSQERVADLGRAMIDNSTAEAELIRATGAYNVEMARIAVLLGLNPAQGLEDGLLASVLDGQAGPAEDFVPKGGSGFGQDDQDKVNRNIE